MSDPNAPLSIDSALSLMLVQPGSESRRRCKRCSSRPPMLPPAANAHVDGADAPDEEDNNHPAPLRLSESAGEAAGAEDTPADQGEATDGQADQGDDALPPIEPPTSWNTEEKAEWKSPLTQSAGSNSAPRTGPHPGFAPLRTAKPSKTKRPKRKSPG
jgi:hypothetical protein